MSTHTMRKLAGLLLCAFVALCQTVAYGEAGPKLVKSYQPDWASLDTRELPVWYDQAKVGIFIHWGVYSVPALGEWFWSNWANEARLDNYVKYHYGHKFTYQDFAPQFSARHFEPDQWAKLFEASGAKYVVLTSKHHEGYTMWPSPRSYSWNSVDVGPNRDLVASLAKSLRSSTKLRFGLYYSQFEWFNPMYRLDKSLNFTTRDYPNSKSLPELYDLVLKYKPEIVWSDGDWETSSAYWGSTYFLAWLFNQSPVKESVVVNDRWGSDSLCKHGSFLTCTDRYLPDKPPAKKWENCLSLDKESFGIRGNASLGDYLTIGELIHTIVRTVAMGGNVLINVGPTREGTIGLLEQKLLTQMGTWLTLNQQAIYSTRPWSNSNNSVSYSDVNNPSVYYTQTSQRIYVLGLEWPENNVLILGSLGNYHIQREAIMLATGQSVTWSQDRQGRIHLKLANVANLEPRLAETLGWAFAVELIKKF